MATILEDLVTVLEGELNIYNELIIIGKEKKNVIIKNDIDTLKKMNVVELSLTNQFKKLENKRTEIFSDIKMLMNINKELTLTVLSEELPEEKDKKTILDLRDSIVKSVEELKEINSVNGLLVENSLDFINFNMNVVRNAKTVDTGTYTKEDLGRK